MNNASIAYAIPLGIILGMVWYVFGERFDKSKMKPKCWEILHYHNKERFPLYLVHLKSMLAGLLLICLAFTKFRYKNELVALIGAAIIGLHTLQWRDEWRFIKSEPKPQNCNNPSNY